MAKFMVEIVGSFHTFELYDNRGREVHELLAAAETAEDLYGSEWQSVFNGNDSVDREGYLDWKERNQ